MTFLCLICAEAVMEQLPQADADKHFQEYALFTESIKASGHFVGANRLKPPETATTVRVRDGPDHRRPLRGDEGAVRRLLPHRGQGLERGDPGGIEDSRGTTRMCRGATNRGRPPDARPRTRRSARLRIAGKTAGVSQGIGLRVPASASHQRESHKNRRLWATVPARRPAHGKRIRRDANRYQPVCW